MEFRVCRRIVPAYDEEPAGMCPTVPTTPSSACGAPRGPTMCLKGKKQAKDKPGNFRCKNCGAISKKKSRLCEPKKIK